MRDLAAELRGTAARERRHGRNDVPQLCEDAADELAALRADRDELQCAVTRRDIAISGLENQVKSLRARVAELEAERASLLEAAQKSRERAARLELKHGRLTTGGPDV